MSINKISDFYGKYITNIEKDEDFKIIFHLEDGSIYEMYHEQDCCESVTIDDVCGDLNDLIDTPIVIFEEVTETGEDGDYESFTWTFYKIATIKGYVDIKWFGTSNGYYSEEVDIQQTKEPDPIEVQRSKKLKKLKQSMKK